MSNIALSIFFLSVQRTTVLDEITTIVKLLNRKFGPKSDSLTRSRPTVVYTNEWSQLRTILP